MIQPKKASTLSQYSKRNQLGQRGEDAVVAYLLHNGFTICERNFLKRSGEIDIIAQRDEVIAFIEVKLRLSDYFNLSTVVTYAKQQKIL